MATNTTRYRYNPQTGERVPHGLPKRIVNGLRNIGIDLAHFTKETAREMLLSGQITFGNKPKNVGKHSFRDLVEWAGLPEDHDMISVRYASTRKEFLKNAEQAWREKYKEPEK